MNPTGPIPRVLLRLFLFLLGGLLLLMVLRIGTGLHVLAEARETTRAITTILGLDARESAWLSITAASVGSFLVGHLALRLAWGSLFPLGGREGLAGHAAILMLLTGLWAALPSLLSTLTGRDSRGAPLAMDPVDPANHDWWNLEGQPCLFYAHTPEGEVEYFLHAATTRHGQPAQPVTRELRSEWEARQAERRREEERIQVEAAKQELKNLHAQREEELNTLGRQQHQLRAELNRYLTIDQELADAAAKEKKRGWLGSLFSSEP